MARNINLYGDISTIFYCRRYEDFKRMFQEMIHFEDVQLLYVNVQMAAMRRLSARYDIEIEALLIFREVRYNSGLRVSIAIGFGLYSLGVGVSLPERSRIFSFDVVKNGTGVQPSLIYSGCWDPSPGVKRPEIEAYHSPATSLYMKRKLDLFIYYPVCLHNVVPMYICMDSFLFFFELYSFCVMCPLLFE
jgi:hypothetical protein